MIEYLENKKELNLNSTALYWLEKVSDNEFNLMSWADGGMRRNYIPKISKVVSLKEAKDLIAISNSRDIEQEKTKTLQKEKAEKYSSWKEKCEGHIFDGGDIVRNGEVIDEYGNYLFRIPKTEIENLDKWYSEKIEEYLEYSE